MVPRLQRPRNTTLRAFDGIAIRSGGMSTLRFHRVTDAAGNDLSFIGAGSSFDVQPTENGNWFTRGAMVVFEYRLRG